MKGMAGKPHRISRNGCMICRRRKIECDEAWPACRKCSTSGRVCDGPSRSRYIFAENLKAAQNFSRKDHISLPSRPNSFLIELSQEESCLFDFFLSEVSPALAGFHDHRLWGTLVPQAFHCDIAFKCLVFGISIWYQSPPPPGKQRRPGSLKHVHIQVLKWCNQSLEALIRDPVDDSDQSREYALLSCILLSTIQFQQNNVATAIRLLRAGFNLACDASAMLSQPSVNVDMLIRTMLRQGVLLLIFGCTITSRQIDICSQYLEISDANMSDLSSIRDQLYACMLRALAFVNAVSTERYQEDSDHCKTVFLLYTDQQRNILEKLAHWYQGLILVTAKMTSHTTSEDQRAMSLMTMCYHVSRIWVIACLAGSNIILDELEQQFSDMLLHADKALQAVSSDKSPFTFELGVIAPLSFVAGHCRHPFIRRKAISLIRMAHMREALFTAEHSALAAERIVALEEAPKLRYKVESGTWDGTLPDQLHRCQYVNQPFKDELVEHNSPAMHFLWPRYHAGVQAGWTYHSLPLYRGDVGATA